jgi:SAM-dependent methyltransferase
MKWSNLEGRRGLKLYAGDIPAAHPQFKTHIGLSLTQDNENHIIHNIEHPFPLPNNSVEVYQSEDVFEHINVKSIVPIIDEIYRVLEPEGLFRLSVPDYRCNILSDRSTWKDGKIIFDPGGGGSLTYDENRAPKVINGGHLWFPVHEDIKSIVDQSKFGASTRIAGSVVNYLHYYEATGSGLGVVNKIDYSLGYISRTPDHDFRVMMPRRPMSIVVDLYKGKE